jgi:hypothetical protein
VYTSGESSVLGTATDALVTAAIPTNSFNIKNKEILVGVDVKTAFTNGVAAASSTTELIVGPSYDIARSPDPYVELIDYLGIRRYYVGIISGSPGSLTFDFTDEGLGEITLISYDLDGFTTTVTYEAAAAGTENGIVVSSKTQFAAYDLLAADAAAKAEDAADNLKAAIETYGTGHDMFRVFANQVSATDTTTSNGRVIIQQKSIGTDTNTSVTIGGTWDTNISGTTPTAFTGGVDEDVNTAQGEFNRNGSIDYTAKSLANAISHSYNHGGSITPSTSGGTLTLTMASGGLAGNTLLGYNINALTIFSKLSSSFTGGSDAVTADLAAQYSFDGSSWTNPEVLLANADIGSTGLKTATFNSINSMPYVRFVLNSNNTTVGTTGTCTFKLSS